MLKHGKPYKVKTGPRTRLLGPQQGVYELRPRVLGLEFWRFVMAIVLITVALIVVGMVLSSAIIWAKQGGWL